MQQRWISPAKGGQRFQRSFVPFQASVVARWQDAGTREVQEINGNFNTWDLYPSFEESDPYFQKAVLVAAFAEVLRASPYTDARLAGNE